MLDSQHPQILAAGAILEQGQVPGDFMALTNQLTECPGTPGKPIR